jgi:Phosphoesterase family
MTNGSGLGSVDHVVVLMLENRSFDHMLGFLYDGQGNVSPAGQPFDGLTGTESNPDATGAAVTVSRIEPATADAYFMPGADPGEGYVGGRRPQRGPAVAPAAGPGGPDLPAVPGRPAPRGRRARAAGFRRRVRELHPQLPDPGGKGSVNLFHPPLGGHIP